MTESLSGAVRSGMDTSVQGHRVVRGLAAVMLAVGVFGGRTPRAEAFVCKVSDTRPHITLHWPGRTVSYGISASSDLRPSGVIEAFDQWSTVECSDLNLRYVGVVEDGDPVNQVTAIRAGWVEAGYSPIAVGLTVTEFDPVTGRIVRSDVFLNEDLFDFTDGDGPCRSGTFDALSVLTHEAGHFVGLDHTQDFFGGSGDPTMAPEVQSCAFDKRSLEPDDEAGLCTIYPAGAVSTGCLGLPDQSEPYVRNRAFGCRATHGANDFPAGGVWGLLLIVLARFGRRRATCPSPRSGG